jgi:hypothetical protein
MVKLLKNYLNMKIYDITGLCRSGNHAIIFWIIHNLVDDIVPVDPYLFIKNQQLCFLNNANHKPGYFNNNYWIRQFDIVIKSYEDKYASKNTSLIIVRDFLNLLSSRYKKYQPHIGLDQNYIYNSLYYLIDVWKQHIKCKSKIIKYNSWLVSKDYRDYISKNIISIPNVADNISYMSDIGEGSSFDDHNFLERYKLVTLPKYMIDQILTDKELLQLNKEIFNIDIEQCLLT